MARKSRKQPLCGTSAPAAAPAGYKTAVYARLSMGDKDFGNDGSLENQILMLERYLENEPELNLCGVFYDNGLTGTNFNRPGFERLMDEIKCKRINCIVVKDLSRFGRDYVEAGNLLEIIFPRLGVRFISVGDNYDSFDPRCKGDGVMLALKNMINSFYSRDISAKIRSAYAVKRKNGEFTGKCPPFGYIKSPENKNKLIVDEEAAKIVQMIFRLKLEGMGPYQIARHLSTEGIPTPGHYRYIKGIHKEERYSTPQFWDTTTVKDILENIEYLGHLAMGKTTVVGGKAKDVPREDWVIAENTHQPIISQVDFDAVAEQLRQTGERQASRNKHVHDELPENLLEGLIFCKDCGRVYRRVPNIMRDKKTYRLTYICVYCNQHSPKYKYRHYRQDDLYNDVYTLIRQQVDNCVNLKATLDKINASEGERRRRRALDKKINKLQKKLDHLISRKMKLYDDLYDGTLSKSEYILINNKYKDDEAALSAELEHVSANRDKHHPDVYESNRCVALVKRFLEDKELSREMLLALVERIEVDGGKHIDIFFRFEDEYKHLENMVVEGGGYLNEQ